MRNFLSILFFIFAFYLVLFAQEEGSVIITEIMYNPASDESTTQTQFIEIANTTNTTTNLNNWTIDDEDGDGPNTLPDIDLPPYGIAVICGSSAADFQGAWGSGFLLISLADLGQTMFNLNNSPSSTSEIIQLRDNNGVLIDEVNYDDASPWPNDNNQSSIYLSIPKSQMNAISNNDGANWSLSVSGVDGAYSSTHFGVWDATDIGSPGNILGDASLPVNLSSFSAITQDGHVLLKWRTESEIDNLGFEIYRSLMSKDGYLLLDSYRTNDQLKGHLSSSISHTYQYLDQTVNNEQTYYYKLADVDLKGQRTFHGPVKVTVESRSLQPVVSSQLIKDFRLHPAFPNPFNPSTTITLDVPQSETGQSELSLNVFNIKGQKVKTLFKGSLQSNSRYQLKWDGSNELGQVVPAGVYFVVLKTSGFLQSQKVCMIK